MMFGRQIPSSTLAPAALAALLCVAAAAAHAQSNVKLSGRVDLNVGKDIGSGSTRMGTGAMSHLSFSGNEDLGEGRQAYFVLTTRINADTGTTNNPGSILNNPPGTFWSQDSYVGLRGTWGSLTLGRRMTAALLPQIMVDPWQWDNTTTIFNATTGLIGNLWYNNSVTYDYADGAFSLTAQVAEKDANPGWAGVARKAPYSFALNYVPGPWQVRLGFERPADGRSRLLSLFGGYDFGAFTLNAMLGDGRDYLENKVRTWAVSSIVQAAGGHQVRLAFGQYARDGDVLSQKLSGGYYHYLSKRTAVYVNATHDNKAATEKGGYELGLQHVF
ncbi:MAG: porin [Aquabacterium sp.]|nr:MAG: porin [Aquabacterium sp.]